jgi:hypothetical protein
VTACGGGTVARAMLSRGNKRMHIDYEISEQDFSSAQRLAIRKSPQFFIRRIYPILPWFGLVLLLFIIFVVFDRGFSTDLLPGFVIPLLCLSIPLLTRRNIRKVYKTSVNLHGPLALEVDDTGMHFQGRTFSSRIDWDHFSRLIEDQHSFLIFQNPNIFNIIPKRQLAEEQIVALRDYLTRHIAS